MIYSKFATRISVLLILLLSCLTVSAKPKEVVYELSSSAQPNFRFNDLSKGLYVRTGCEIDNSQIYDLSQVSEKVRKATLKKVHIGFKPEIASFFDESFKKYVTAAGFTIGYDRNHDYILRAELKEFKLADGIGSVPCTVIIEWSLISPEHTIVLNGEAKGRYVFIPGQGQSIPGALDKAYEKALADIDWRGIAYHLGNGDKKSEEKNKQVTGDGTTDLEHTVIRWYVISSPPGADVSWRVISSTPDVKNTNSNYVGTTPYETTESFDIKGMKYNNSGNIQIEITCEKTGYLPQRKRFNLRQAIDQKEISAKFNLIKDNENN